MNTTRRALFFAIAGALMVAALPPKVQAAEPTQEHKAKMPMSFAHMMKMDPAECMKMMDHGNKGYVTKEEFMKFQEELFKGMDKKKNNRVSTEEFLYLPSYGG